MEEIKAKREKMMMEHQFQQQLQQYQARFEEQHNVIQALAKENVELKTKVATLDAQIKKIIEDKIKERKATKI
jgi:predicted transcriptional regulator